MTGTGNESSTDGKLADSAGRFQDTARPSRNGTARELILFFALGVSLILFTIGISVFGTANVADWAFPTVEARSTSSAEERARAAATLAKQTDIAAAIELTETAVSSTDGSATSRSAAEQDQPPSPPVITNVELIEDRLSGSLIVYQQISFNDLDGDAHYVHYELVRTTSGFVEVKDGDINVRGEQQKSGALITGTWDCGTGTYSVTLQASIWDMAGNQSNARQYTINCR